MAWKYNVEDFDELKGYEDYHTLEAVWVAQMLGERDDRMKWINSDEHLPEKDGCYLVNEIFSEERETVVRIFTAEDLWIDAAGIITHWMPLPDPPTSE